MKNMKARILRNLKNISTITQKQGPGFHSNSFLQASTPHKEHTISGLINNATDEDFLLVSNMDNEDKFRPYMTSRDRDPPIEEIEGHSELKPNDMEDSRSLEFPSISDFEEKCPPGGTDSVILYTTSLRGIRKTFEDCNAIRFLLDSFRVVYYERDVSMHLEYRDELWRVMGGRVVPPRLFIRGRDIGGADAVIGLHEKGMLKKLLHGISLTQSNTPCNGCGGMHFVLCFHCNGCRKIFQDEQVNGLSSVRCPHCNENGLIKCSICS